MLTIRTSSRHQSSGGRRYSDNAQSQRDLSISLNRLGDILIAIGDLEAARWHFGQALAISHRVADADPANAQSQRDLSISLNRLGDIRVAMGDLEAALRHFEQALAISRRLAEPILLTLSPSGI